MICLRHRSASGDLANGWEYDPRERSILCNVRKGALSVEFRVAICSVERPMLGAHPTLRLDAESWRIPPERYIRTWPNRIERLETIRCPIVGELGYVTIALTNTPHDVSEMLEGL